MPFRGSCRLRLRQGYPRLHVPRTPYFTDRGPEQAVDLRCCRKFPAKDWQSRFAFCDRAIIDVCPTFGYRGTFFPRASTYIHHTYNSGLDTGTAGPKGKVLRHLLAIAEGPPGLDSQYKDIKTVSLRDRRDRLERPPVHYLVLRKVCVRHRQLRLHGFLAHTVWPSRIRSLDCKSILGLLKVHSRARGPTGPRCGTSRRSSSMATSLASLHAGGWTVSCGSIQLSNYEGALPISMRIVGYSII